MLHLAEFAVSGAAVPAPGGSLVVEESAPPRLTIVDHRLPERDDGITIARQLSPCFGTAIIFMTGPSDIAADARLPEAIRASLRPDP